jgi:type II secretory pathway pseudopilin PulG
MSLLELVVVLALVGAVLAFSGSTVSSWGEDQRARTSARAVADAFNLGRAEAIRTGSNHIVAFDVEPGLGGISADVVIANDGPTGTSNCRIDVDEIVHSVTLERGVSFGSDADLANGAPAPDDPGASGHQAAGASFTDADDPAGDASWVMFSAEGLPRRFSQNAAATPPCDALGSIGEGGGAIYLTNGRRDYAVVLSPLGVVRLHGWQPGGGGWSQ